MEQDFIQRLFVNLIFTEYNIVFRHQRIKLIAKKHNSLAMRVSFASFLVGVVVVAAVIAAADAQFGVYTKTEVDKGQWDESATADKVRATVKTKCELR